MTASIRTYMASIRHGHLIGEYCPNHLNPEMVTCFLRGQNLEGRLRDKLERVVVTFNILKKLRENLKGHRLQRHRRR